MTDEARIAKLTELARRVWPDVHSVYEHDGYIDAGAIAMQGGYRLHLRIGPHPRALDALEAALLVLAGEGIAESVCRRDCDGYWEQHQRAERATAWVEQLASVIEDMKKHPESVTWAEQLGAIVGKWRNGGEPSPNIPSTR